MSRAPLTVLLRRFAETLAVVLVLAAPRLLWAAAEGEGHAGHGEGHGIPWLTLFFATVNLSIFLLILARFLGPTIRHWVADRRDRVIAELDAAARARAEAERLQAEWQARIDNLSREIDEIHRRARSQAEHERDQILNAARETAERIASDAERAAANEVRRAQESLRDEVAREAVTAAERLIRERLTPADHDRFVREFADEVKT